LHGDRTVISYHIKQLADLCSDHPVTPKTVFVPSVQAGVALGTALAREGTNWINLRFSTPEDIAREISEPGFLADGWSPLPKDADLIELVPIVTDFLSSPANIYFRNQPFSHGLLRSIHRTLRALRIAGTRPETLLKQRGSHKLRAIAQLYVAFQDCLESRQWFDGPDLFSAATATLERDPAVGNVYAILDETPLPGLAKQFVRKLAGNGIKRIGRSQYGVSIPETLAAHAFSDLDLISEAECQPAGRALIGGARGLQIDNLELRTSTGPEIEIRNTLALILEGGWPLDSVEIACATPEYLNYAYDATRGTGIPTTFGTGVSILQTRPGQVLRSALNWIVSGGDPGWMKSLTAGRLLNIDPGPIKDSSSPLWQLDQLIQQPGSTTAAHIASLGALLLVEHVTTLDESEEPARDSLVPRLQELSLHSKAEGSAHAMAGALLEVVRTHRFEARSQKPGYLNIVPLERAGLSGRAQVFVLGLDNSSFPGAPGEDPLLLDHERSRISGDLEMLRTRPTAQTWHLVRLLGLAPNATLSASIFRLSDGQESEPASLFHHLRKLTSTATPVEPLLSDLGQAPRINDWTLSWARNQGSQDSLRPVSPWLFQGGQAARERTDQTFTRFKGVTGAAPGSIDPARDILSASRLETLARCPYRYFWRYVLHVEPSEEEGADPTKWLSPLDFGSLLHELYQKFMSELLERDKPPSVEQDTDRLLELLEEVVDQTAQRIPPPNPLAFDVDVARLEAAARTFLAEESKRPPTEHPRGFEISFGFDAVGGLNHPDPVSLDFGDFSIRLRGLIDRVDRTKEGYIVWDYKTGSAIPYDESDLLGGGTHLQWALYAHALQEILKTKADEGPIQSGYYFASDREHGRKMLATPPTRAELGQMLRPVMGLAERGAFPPIQKTSQCLFCEYKAICEKDRMLPKSITSLPDAKTDLGLIELAAEWLSN